MDSSIRQWHLILRAPRSLEARPFELQEFQTQLRREALAAYERALPQSSTVWIVRAAQLSYSLPPGQFDFGTLGRQLAQAVQSTIDQHQHDPDQIARFDNEAHFAASFLRDLLCGDPWAAWYYTAFAAWKGRTAAETLPGVLRDHPACWASILGYLRQWGLSSTILQGAPHLDELVAQWNEEAARSHTAAARPILETAWIIGVALRYWSPARPTEAQLAEATGALGAQTDWTSAAALAGAVYRGIHHFQQINPVPNSVPSEAEIHSALEPYDWLDREVLTERILASAPPRAHHSAEHASTHVDRALAYIEQELRAGRLVLPREASPDARALETVAFWAASIHPATIPEKAQRALLRALLGAGTPVSFATAQAITGGPGELRKDLSGPAPPQRFRLATSQPASSQAPQNNWQTNWQPTPNAGLFLLVRTLQDLRWIPLVRKFTPDAEPVLYRLAQALTNGTPADLALPRWAGLADPPVCIEEGFPIARFLDAHRERLPESMLAAEFPPGAEPPGYAALASILIAHWRRWLPGFGDSSESFTRERLLTHAGAIRVSDGHLDVWLERGPLDTVLEMGGCFEPVAAVPWWGGARLSFHGSPS